MKRFSVVEYDMYHQVSAVLNKGKYLLYYVRDRKNRKIGLVLAYKDPHVGCIKIGWSKCNIKLDNFNKIYGLWKAIKRAKPIGVFTYNVPHSLGQVYNRMLDRAVKYFKVEFDPAKRYFEVVS